MEIERIAPLTPVNFFQLSLECHNLLPKGKFPRLQMENFWDYCIPNTSGLCYEENFADVAMGWSVEGLEFLFFIRKPYEAVSHPNIRQGDSIELFIDTRDLKTSGYNTRFCHHFFFLPEPVEGVQAGEMTHFRTEDAHELCDPALLEALLERNFEEYTLHCFVPRECLHGYDPDQFDRLGFTYRINRPYYEPQHLSVVTDDYKLEQQPSLWSSMRFVK